MFGKKNKAVREKEQELSQLERMRGRMEALEGILYAQENPEKVFDIISHSKTPKDILINLMEQCQLTKFQAQCISDMRLRVFSEPEKNKVAEEYAQVRKACEQGEIG